MSRFVDRCPLDALPELAEAAMAEQRIGDESDNLLVDISLQSPSVVAPYLEELWDLWAPRPRWGDDTVPWRAATSPDAMERLASRLADPDPDVAQRAAECLLETRTDVGLRLGTDAREGGIEQWRWGPPAQWVARERDGHRFRRLFVEPAAHLEFPPTFFGPPTWSDEPSPTWSFDGPVVGTARFGGRSTSTCGTCGEGLDCLFRFDEPAVGRPRDLVVCIACNGWQYTVQWFDHRDPNGDPAHVDSTMPSVGQTIPVERLPESVVWFRRTPARFELQSVGVARDAGQNLNRLGGEPTWVQGPQFNECIRCGRTMQALLQLDSFDNGYGWAVLWGSGGILYVQWCEACSISAVFWQCT